MPVAKGLLAVRGDYWKQTRSVFNLSCGRVGTESLSRLLGLSNHIISFHEPAPQLEAERRMARLEIQDDPGKYRRIFAEARSVPLATARMAGKIYAEASARMTFLAPVIAELVPESKFIFQHRHPAEIVRSGMRRGWYVSHRNDSTRITPGPSEDAFKHWDDWDAFRKICWYWDAYHRFILNFIDQMPASRVLEVPFVDFFHASASTPRIIFEFVGVPIPSNQAIDACMSIRHNAQEVGEFPRFSEWSDEHRAILQSIAGGTMERLGYGMDDVQPASHSMLASADGATAKAAAD